MRKSLGDWVAELTRGAWAVVAALVTAAGIIVWAVTAKPDWLWITTAGLLLFLCLSFNSYHRVRTQLEAARQAPPPQQHYHYHYTFDQPPLHFPPPQPDTHSNRPLFDQDDADGAA